MTSSLTAVPNSTTESSSTTSSSSSSLSIGLDKNEPIFCWLCRDRMELTNNNIQAELINNHWVIACNCEGVRKYAHQKCLLTFIINKKYYNLQWDTTCSWCNVPYLITVDGPSIWYRIQTFCDNVLGQLTPCLVSTGVCLSVATLAYCYSDALLGFLHAKEEFFELFDCQIYDVSFIVSRCNLMLMPISLIYFESYNWEHFVATKIIYRMLKQRSLQWQNFLMMDDIFNHDSVTLDSENNLTLFTPNLSNGETTNSIVLEFDNATGGPDATTTTSDNDESTLQVDVSNLDVYPRQKRNFVGYVVTGLTLPFISSMFASLLFPRINHNLARAYLGWTCIQAIRGAIRIAYQVHTIKRVTSIKIFNRNQPIWGSYQLN